MCANTNVIVMQLGLREDFINAVNPVKIHGRTGCYSRRASAQALNALYWHFLPNDSNTQ